MKNVLRCPHAHSLAFMHRSAVACLHVKHRSAPAPYNSPLLKEGCCANATDLVSQVVAYITSPVLNCSERHTFLQSLLPSSLLCDHSRGFINVRRVLGKPSAIQSYGREGRFFRCAASRRSDTFLGSDKMPTPEKINPNISTSFFRNSDLSKLAFRPAS